MNSPEDLERLIGQALQSLPGPRAPRSLLPRVMAAVAARANRPWYAREWASWPRAWQLASMLALTVAVSAMAFFTPAAVAFIGSAATFVVVETFARVFGWHLDANAVLVVGRAALTALEVVTSRALPVVLLMYVTCVALGATLKRVAFGEASL